MEAVRIDKLPSTESNKLCSLLSTDAHDSNEISKEKEEELLYGTGEDVDEDDALSDDSLRLKFSDDEEADQDDTGSSERFYKPVKEEDTSEDAKFETSEALDTNEEKLLVQQGSASETKSFTEEILRAEEKGEEQTEYVDGLKESESFVESAHGQDTVMNGNDPRYFQSAVRSNFENRWRQNSARPRMSFNNHPPHQRSYYQNSNFGPSETEIKNSRYYNKQSHYGRNRGSGKSHHQNYSEHSNWNSKSRALDRRKDSNHHTPTIKVIETNKTKSEQENKDSTSELEKIELSVGDKTATINDVKIEIGETFEEEISPESREKEEEILKECPIDSESLPVESSTEEATAPSLQNTLMETDEMKETQEPSNEPNENSTEKNPEFTEVVESEPNDEYAHLEKETGDVAGMIADVVTDEKVEECNNVEELKDQAIEGLQNEETDLSKVQSPDDDPENCEDGQEDLGFETPTEDATPRKAVVSDSSNIDTPKDAVVEPASTISDVPISVNDDSESAIENLPKVYQCLEEIASMEALRRAEEVEKEGSIEKVDITKQTESCKLNIPMTSEESSTIQMTENSDDAVPITSEKSISMEEDTSLPDDAILPESELLKEPEELLNNEDGDHSNLSMGSAETIVVGPSENIEERVNEVEKMDFDDNACQSNEDAKAADANNKAILDTEDSNEMNRDLIVNTDLTMEEDGNCVSNDVNDASKNVSNDVSNDISNDVSNGANTDMVRKMIEDDSNSRNSIFTEKKNVEDDSKEDIKHTDEVVNIEEEKMCVDDNECLEEKSATSAEKCEVEASTISNECSSNESQESSTSATITMKESDENESKTDNTSNAKRKKRRSNVELLETPEKSSTGSAEGEGSRRQKRRTAKNAEEIIRTKFLGSDSDIESDDSGKFVSVNYRSRNDLQCLSPPSLKRNLEDHDEDSFDGATVKKIKMTLEPPKHLIKQIKEEDDKKNLESIRNLTSVRKFFQRDIKGQLKKLKQEELEELLIQKIVETITMSSEIGRLREQARLSEKNQEVTRTKCQQLAKQIQDFEMVLKRNAADRSTGSDKYVAPIKINRSVGLQVNFISDHGMQNMRQIQQNAKSSITNAAATSTNEASAVPRRGIKVRSPRRSETVSSTVMTPPVQSHIQTPTLHPASPAASASTKPAEPTRTLPMPVQTVSAQPVISSINTRSPNKMGIMQAMQSTQQSQQNQQTQQTLILNGNITNRLPTTASLKVQKQKSNDLIDLTDEEEKTKSTVSAPMTVSTATIITNPQNQRTIMQGHSAPHYQRLIQVPPGVALSNQANIRVLQHNSQSTPAAIMNNINAPRLTYVMPSGGQPRQILIANPNSIRQGHNRNQFSAVTYKTANGIPTSANGTLRLLTTQANPNAQANKHPAPLPDSGPSEVNPSWKLPPPAPTLKISKVSTGIVLSWNMPLSDKHAEIVSYQLFAYQEVSGTSPSTMLWKKVGDVMALPLPMACTLTQLVSATYPCGNVILIKERKRNGKVKLLVELSMRNGAGQFLLLVRNGVRMRLLHADLEEEDWSRMSIMEN